MSRADNARKPSRIVGAVRFVLKLVYVQASILTVVLLLLIAFWSKSLGGLAAERILTTTVTATTESFTFMTSDNRETAWTLPPGKFSILGIADGGQCMTHGYESVCEYAENTRFVIDGAAGVVLQTAPTGGWTLSVSASNDLPIDVRLYDTEERLLLQSDQFLDFHARAGEAAIRVPFVADSAVLGADLHQSSTIDGSPDDFWQPILLRGDVLMIADNKPGREKYEVLSERLDPGDVIHIGSDNAEQANDGGSPVWGMVSIATDDADDNIPSGPFEIVLHTSVRDLSVTRFGAPDGHVIRVSSWTIWQKWPNGQSAWVAFVSAILILTFILELAASLNETKKKKLSKKSRNGAARNGKRSKQARN